MNKNTDKFSERILNMNAKEKMLNLINEDYLS